LRDRASKLRCSPGAPIASIAIDAPRVRIPKSFSISTRAWTAIDVDIAGGV